MTIAVGAMRVARAADRQGTPPDPANLQRMATTEAEIRARGGVPAEQQPPRPVVIEFTRVTKTYPGGDVGVDDVSFAIRRGEFVFLVGSTGSGKSTLMRLLIKELEPSAGTIRVAGRSLADITRSKTPYYRRNLGVVFQDFKLLPNRTVHDNVAYALQVTGGSRKEVRAKVPDILRLTGLSTKLHSYPDQLSGASSSACRWRGPSSITRRCCCATSPPGSSTPRRASASCSCSTGSTAQARRCWSRPTTT